MSISKTEQTFVDVARKLFAKNGLDGTTMNDIARESGKGRRTLYTYFSKKEDIYSAVIESELERLSEKLDEVTAKIFTDKLAGIPCFYCRGAFDMKNMTFKDRTLCRMLRKMLAGKDPSTCEVWEEAIMSVSEDEAGDWTDPKYLEPILSAL